MTGGANILVRVLRSWVCIGVCFVAVIVQCAAGDAIHKWVVGSLGIVAGMDGVRPGTAHHTRVGLLDDGTIVAVDDPRADSHGRGFLVVFLTASGSSSRVELIQSREYFATANLAGDPLPSIDISAQPFVQDVLRTLLRKSDGTLYMNERQLRELFAGERVKISVFYWPGLAQGLFELFVLVVLVTGVVLRFRWSVEKRRLREYQCPRCSYDLRGLAADTCPECGVELEWPDEGHRRAVEQGRV